MIEVEDFKNLSWLFKQMLPPKYSEHIEVEFQHRYVRRFVRISTNCTI